MRAILLATALLLNHASGARADPFPMSEYEKHVSRYLEGLAGLSVRVSDTDQTLDGSVRILSDVTIDTIKDHMRAKRVRRSIRRDAPESTTTEHVLLRPDGCYWVREASPGQYALELHEPKATSPLLLGGDSPIQPIVAPISRRWYSLPESLHGRVQNHLHVPTGFKRLPNGLEFLTRDTVNGDTSETKYDLDQDWLIKAYTIRSSSGHGKVTHTISYTTFQGVKVPERITIEFRTREGSNLPPSEVLLRDYTPFTGTRTDFSLRQFGLPEAMGYEEANRAPRTWLYLFAAAVVFVGVWIVFAFRARRLKQATAI